jgi:CBS domain-containing protein
MRTDLPEVSPEASFEEVVETMKKNNSDIVVIKEKGEIVGLITDSDIVAWRASGNDTSNVKAYQMMTPCEVMGRNPCLQINEDDDIENAMKVMAISGVRHLLVWGEGGKAKGVLCAHELI